MSDASLERRPYERVLALILDGDRSDSPAQPSSSPALPKTLSARTIGGSNIQQDDERRAAAAKKISGIDAASTFSRVEVETMAAPFSLPTLFDDDAKPPVMPHRLILHSEGEVMTVESCFSEEEVTPQVLGSLVDDSSDDEEEEEDWQRRRCRFSSSAASNDVMRVASRSPELGITHGGNVAGLSWSVHRTDVGDDCDCHWGGDSFRRNFAAGTSSKDEMEAEETGSPRSSMATLELVPGADSIAATTSPKEFDDGDNLALHCPPPPPLVRRMNLQRGGLVASCY